MLSFKVIFVTCCLFSFGAFEVVENAEGKKFSDLILQNFNANDPQDSRTLIIPHTFKTVGFKDEGKDGMIHNLTLNPKFDSKLTKVTTDTKNNAFYVEMTLRNVQLTGAHKIGEDSDKSTEIKFELEKVTVKGNIGFERNQDNSVTNMFLDFDTDKVKATLPGIKVLTTEFRKSPLKGIDNLIWYQVQKQIEGKINNILKKDAVKKSSVFASDKRLRQDINPIVDELLIKANKMIKDSGHSSIDLPNFEWEKNVLICTVTVKLWNGKAYDLSTLLRAGNFTLTSLPNGDSAVFGPLTLTTLGAKYGNWNAKCWVANVGGTITVFVGKNKASINLVVDNSLKVKTADLKIDELGDYKIEVTGLGPLNVLADYFLTRLANQFQGYIRERIEQVANEEIKKVIGQL